MAHSPNKQFETSSRELTNEIHYQKSTSKWTIGWRTPVLLALTYLGAFVIASVHLSLFYYLDGKIASGSDRIVSQTYVSTSSNVLATGFQMTLQLSLGTAFVQYLWYMFRVSSIRVSTIEDLFSLRTSPLALLRISTPRTAPVLVSLAILIWSTYISTSFPPGAISVESKLTPVFKSLSVPTFNASFIGNRSGVDASLFTLDSFVPAYLDDRNDHSLSSYLLSYAELQPVLQGMANEVVVGGMPAAIPSPCGVNCSYTIQFDGPWLQCNESSSNVTLASNLSSSTDAWKGYNGYWNDSLHPGYQSLNIPSKPPLRNNSETSPYKMTFSANTLNPVAYSNVYDNDIDLFLATQRNLTCTPTRATYTVFNSYESSSQAMEISISDIQPLTNFYQAADNNAGVDVPGFYGGRSGISEPGIPQPGIAQANWTTDTIAWYRDLNLLNLIGVAMDAIAGSYVVSGPSTNISHWENLPGFGNVTYSSAWSAIPSNDGCQPGASPGAGSYNGTLIANSRFNDYFATKFERNEFPQISFTVNEEMLNSLLKNITINAITFYNYWNTTANVTINSPIIIYTLSSPLSIILPYGLSLLLAVPFIILGFRALRQNGVAAIDGGFIQLICTSNGSELLERHASMGCLGGQENIPAGLRDLKIRFGELRSRRSWPENGEEEIPRAGFGTEDEILPLRKEARYGGVALGKKVETWI